jgi:hypothetical protein
MVVTRRLMPGTMSGNTRYPSLGYRLVPLIRERGANPVRGSVAAELTQKLEARVDRRAIRSCCGYGEEPHHLVAFPSMAHRARYGWTRAYDRRVAGSATV